MLGVRRASVSIAAREMKLKRYISYSRGNISLLNLPALHTLAKNSQLGTRYVLNRTE
jgi:hypothetical protein